MPPQRTIPPAMELPERTLADFADADVGAFIVGGVLPGGAGASRWSSDRPEFKFALSPKRRYAAVMSLAISESTFQTTGPVTIEYFVNGQSLKKVVYSRAGDQEFEELVPAELTATGAAVLAAQITPVWIAPGDGARLGVLLKQAGFVPK